MSKTPYFLVEGVDDISVYEAIAKSFDIECEIYSVEMIDGLAGGNSGVIQAMEILDGLNLANGKNVENYVLGIVDRDARFYRQEIPQLASILCLKFYSIESHFVSQEVIRPVIDKITRISISDEIDIEVIFQKVECNLIDLYYFSIDALKNAVDPGYQSIVGYSTNVGRRKDAQTISLLQNRKADLDFFAQSLGLSSSIKSMQEFVKGKWLLTAFSEELYEQISKLAPSCKNAIIKKCRMCEFDLQAPCLFRLKDGFKKNNPLYSLLPDFVGISELDYIKSKMSDVRATAVV